MDSQAEALTGRPDRPWSKDFANQSEFLRPYTGRNRFLDRVANLTYLSPSSLKRFGLVAGFAAVAAFAIHAQSPQVQYTEVSVAKPLTQITRLEPSETGKFLFGGYNYRQLQTINKQLSSERKSFLSDIEEYLRTIGTNLYGETITSVILDSRLKIPGDETQTWEKIMKMVVFTESGGNAFARSNAGAEGLAQVKPSVARKYSGELGKPIFDLFDPEDNLLFATYHLKNLYHTYGDNISLAFAAYNLGDSIVTLAMKTYLKEDLGLNPQEIDEDFESLGLDGGEPATRVYAKKWNLTWEELMESKDVIKKLTLSRQELIMYNTRLGVAGLTLFPNDFAGIFAK